MCGITDGAVALDFSSPTVFMILLVLIFILCGMCAGMLLSFKRTLKEDAEEDAEEGEPIAGTSNEIRSKQEKEKEKSIEQERTLPLATSRIESEVEREDKNLRETIRYNACGYFESQAERYRQTITNLNLKQKETRLKLAEELQLTDELKRTNKNGQLFIGTEQK